MTPRHLNTVAKPEIPCPGCKRREPMHVYTSCVIWACGHTRSLPPIAPTGRRSQWQKEAAA